jgi:hypothetical protein
MNIMTGQANSRVPEDNNCKKNSGMPGKKISADTKFLQCVSNHSLSGFPDKEPDIYRASDLAVTSPTTLLALKKSDNDIRNGRVKTIKSVDDLLNETI